MKTTFHRRYSYGEPKSKWVTYAIIALVFSASLAFIFRSQIVSIISPIWRGQNFIALGFKNVVSLVKDKDRLVKENTALKEKLASYEAMEQALRNLEDTQVEMLEVFGRGIITNFVAASVLTHPPETPYDILIVDAGEIDGVSVGDSVSLPEGGALGKVVEVYEDQSKIELYSGSGVETNVYLERNNVPLKLIGKGGGAFEVELPRDVGVEVGDKILLPDIQSELVGVVLEVISEPTDSTKTVIVRGVGNINSVRFVSIH